MLELAGCKEAWDGNCEALLNTIYNYRFSKKSPAERGC
jgi:hypothetical protein